MPETPKTRKYSQPLGLKGIAHSLDEVSKKAIEGGKDEVVRAWATHVLARCGFPKGARARATCALADTRLYPWIPDPVDVEFVPAPRLMMPNLLTGEPAVYLADDCDGLTARWLALCLAMGVRARVVGYSFGTDEGGQANVISHVLGAIWDDVAEEWVKGDPSFQTMPLGTTQVASWEEHRDLPSMTIICDAVACDLKKAPDPMNGVTHFVGVGSPHSVGAGVDENLPSTGTHTSQSVDAPPQIGEEFISLADDVDAHWAELKTMYDLMRSGFAAQGLSDLKQLEPYGWSAENQQDAIDYGVMAQLCSRYLREAVDGVRSIFATDDNTPAMAGISEGVKDECTKTGGTYAPLVVGANSGGSAGCTCPAGLTYEFGKGCVDAAGHPVAAREMTWGLERRPQDVLGVELNAQGNPVLVNAQGTPTHATPGNSVGDPMTIAAVIAAAVITVAVVYAVVKGLESLTNIVKDINETRLDSQATECFKPGSTVPKEECERRVAARREYALKKQEAERRLHETEGDKDPINALTKLFNSALYVGGAVLTGYGIYRLVKYGADTSDSKKASAT